MISLCQYHIEILYFGAVAKIFLTYNTAFSILIHEKRNFLSIIQWKRQARPFNSDQKGRKRSLPANFRSKIAQLR
jgi:hypothetical protein